MSLTTERAEQKLLREVREKVARDCAAETTALVSNGHVHAPTSRLDLARWFTKRSARVIPLQAGLKIPYAGTRGHLDATCDEAVVLAWFAGHPQCNYGVVPGRLANGRFLSVLDLDVKNGKNGIQFFRDLCARLDVDADALWRSTLVSATVTGAHLYVISEQPIQHGNALIERDSGLDVKANSQGYVVGPGSIVNGVAYTIEQMVEDFGRLPVAICEAIGYAGATRRARPTRGQALPVEIDPTRARRQAEAYLRLHAPVAIQGSGGDTTTYTVAARVKDFGVNEVDAVGLLLTHWNDRCQPPWSPEDLEEKVAHAYTYGREPIGVSAPEVEFSPVDVPSTGALDPQAPWLDVMNEDNFIVNHGREVVVYRPSYDPVMQRNKYDKHPFSALQQLYQNDLVNVKQASGKVVEQNKAAAWLNHPQRRQYLKGAAYAPGQILPDGTFNLDTGYGLTPTLGDWPLMRAHIKKVICNGDEHVDRYVMGWLADAVQHRGDRGQVALVLRGERGVGKGILGNALLRIFGQHGLYLSNSEQLVGKFNSHLEDASFLFGDECFFPGDKRHLSTLKALITEGTIPIEAKFESVRMAKNCLHILLASNDQFVVPAGRDERRFCVLDVSDTQKQNRAYFDPLRQELGLDADTNGHGNGAAAMLYDLLRYDLSCFDITKIPKTDALLDQKLHGLSATANWLLDCLQHGRFEVPFAEGGEWETTAVTLTKANVYNTYRMFSKLAREYKSEEVGPWMKELKKLLSGCVQDSRPWSGDGTRPRMLTFQKLADCRTAFETWIGHTIEWRTDAEKDADSIKELSEEIFGK